MASPAQADAAAAGREGMAKLRLVQVGLGFWGFDWATEVLPRVREVELVAYVDPDPTLYRLPCADVEPSATPVQGPVMRAAQHKGNSSQGGLDWCSPLCQCHCCAGFAMPPVPALAFLARPAARYPAGRWPPPHSRHG